MDEDSYNYGNNDQSNNDYSMDHMNYGHDSDRHNDNDHHHGNYTFHNSHAHGK